MTAQLMKRLRQGARPLLWDGGVGTALIARGLELGRQAPEDWLLQRPDEVRAVHAEFAAAGADVVQTNSFGLLAQGVKAGRALSELVELAKKSVALAAAGAQERAGAPSLVVAALGPVVQQSPEAGYFDRLATTAELLTTSFAEAGAQALHLETACDPNELNATLEGVRAAGTSLPIFVSVTVTAGQGGFETPLGVTLQRMLQELLRTPPDAVGLNCALPARRMNGAVAALAELVAGRLPILVQPQVDQSAPDCKRPSTPETPERFARDLLALLDEGATAVGGCCGARAAHIAAVRAALDGKAGRAF